MSPTALTFEGRVIINHLIQKVGIRVNWGQKVIKDIIEEPKRNGGYSWKQIFNFLSRAWQEETLVARRRLKNLPKFDLEVIGSGVWYSSTKLDFFVLS